MNDIDEDHNKILQIVAIKYLIQNTRLLFLVFILTAMLGLITFYIYQMANELHEVFMPHDTDTTIEEQEELDEHLEASTFMARFNLLDNKRSENVVIMIYFIFTSLSTVGFGDYYPVGDFERLFTSLILLAGVATFSYIMNNFMQIVKSMEEFNGELEDSEGL